MAYGTVRLRVGVTSPRRRSGIARVEWHRAGTTSKQPEVPSGVSIVSAAAAAVVTTPVPDSLAELAQTTQPSPALQLDSAGNPAPSSTQALQQGPIAVAALQVKDKTTFSIPAVCTPAKTTAGQRMAAVIKRGLPLLRLKRAVTAGHLNRRNTWCHCPWPLTQGRRL